MESKVNYALVGAFVITLIAAITFAIIWLSSGLSNKEYNTFKSYFDESVSGLSIGSPVKYSGVDVGTVKDIELNPTNPHEVEILMSIQEGAPITRSTVAIINTQGLTGISYIDLKTRGDDLSPIAPTPGEEYLIIPTGPSLFTRLDTEVNLMLTNINLISEQVQSLLSTQNRQAFSQSLANLNLITHHMANDTQKLDIIMQNTAQASQKLPLLLQNGATTVNSLNTQTVPSINQMLGTLNATASNLLNISNQIKQNPAVLIRGKPTPALGPGER